MGLFSSIGSWGKKEVSQVVSTEELIKNKNWIASVSKIIFRRKFTPARIETFEEVISRRELTDSDLAALYGNHKIIFYLSLTFMMLAISLVIYYLFSRSYFGVFTGFASVGILTAKLFNSSFRAYQIKNRKMVDVKEWWNDGDGWFPTSL